MLPQTASHHLAQAREGGFDARHVRRVLGESVLVADGFGTFVRTDFGIEPAARVEAVGLPGESQSPLAEAFAEELFVQARQVAHLANAQRVQVLFRHLAHAGDLADVERR